VPVTVVRSAFYLSNDDGSLASARDDGVITSFLPGDGPLPWSHPRTSADWRQNRPLPKACVRELLLRPAEQTGIRHVEGPARYSPNDVARAFADALGRPVKVEIIPRKAWVPTFMRQGFSAEAARSYSGMTTISVDGGVELPTSPTRGPTTLTAYAYAHDLVHAGPG